MKQKCISVLKSTLTARNWFLYSHKNIKSLFVTLAIRFYIFNLYYFIQYCSAYLHATVKMYFWQNYCGKCFAHMVVD